MSAEPQNASATRRMPPRVWLIPLAVAALLVANGLASFGDQRGVQSQSGTLLDPAEYAFAIWLPIFLATAAFAVYQALPRHWHDATFDRAALPFIVGQVGGTVFAVAVLMDDLWLSRIATIVYFVGAMGAYFALRVGAEEASWGRRLAVWLHASMSFAWLVAASLIVLAGIVVGADLEAPIATPEVWAAGGIVLAAALAVVLLILRHDLPYAAVTVWALVAIAAGQSDRMVVGAVVVSVAAVSLAAVGAAYRRRG